MRSRLHVEFDPRPLERIEADLVVAGIVEDERPLRGGAARVDWRLCAFLSDLVAGARASGRPGESILLPTSGRLGSPRVLLIGLGPRDRYRGEAVRRALAEVGRRSLALGAGAVALSPPGIEADDVARHAVPFLSGLASAVAAEPGATLRLLLSLPPEETASAARAFEDAASVLPTTGLDIELPSAASWAGRRSGPSSTDPSSPRGPDRRTAGSRGATPAPPRI